MKKQSEITGEGSRGSFTRTCKFFLRHSKKTGSDFLCDCLEQRSITLCRRIYLHKVVESAAYRTSKVTKLIQFHQLQTTLNQLAHKHK